MYFSGTGSSFLGSAGLLVLLLLGNWHHGVMCDQQAGAITSNEVGVSSSSAAIAGSSNGKKQHVSSFVSNNVGPTAASSAVPVSGDEQYRATYFYPVPHHVNWNRDTYADAASEFGYNSQQQQQSGHQTAATVTGPVYSPAYGVSGDADGYEDSFGGGLGGLGGLGGVAGILGIKGIKGLGILALAKAAIPVLAILLPALLLLPLIFLFFPVPVITVPATGNGRTLVSGLGLGDISGKVSHLARSVLESDKCVERISCEVSRVSRGSFLDKTLKRVIPRIESHMPQTLKRIARVYMEGGQSSSSCSKKYTCYLMDDSSGSSSSNNVTAKKTPSS